MYEGLPENEYCKSTASHPSTRQPSRRFTAHSPRPPDKRHPKSSSSTLLPSALPQQGTCVAPPTSRASRPITSSSPPYFSPADVARLQLELEAKLSMTLESELAAAMTALPAKRSAHDTNSPAQSTPARISTPPPPSERGRLEPKPNGDIINTRSSRHIRREGSIGGLDPEILSRALSRELSADRRDSVPAASPSRKRQRINGDRLVMSNDDPSCTRADPIPDSSPRDQGRICKQASVCSMKKALPPRLRGKRSEHPTASFISKGVSDLLL